MEPYVSKLQGPEMDDVFDAILSLKDRSECYRFFEDVCTIGEQLAIAQRWQVARHLDEGMTYQDISRRYNASTATISRVNRCLEYGAGGYRLLLDRLKQKESE